MSSKRHLSGMNYILGTPQVSTYFLALASLPWESMLTSGPIENMDAVKAKYAEQSDDEVL